MEERFALVGIWCQAIFGALAIAGVMFAAVVWRQPDALAFALVACALVVVSQSFQIRSLAGSNKLAAIGFALWIGAFVATGIAFVALA